MSNENPPNEALEAVEKLLLDQFLQWAKYSENNANGGPQFRYPCPSSMENVVLDEDYGLIPGSEVNVFTYISYDKAQTHSKYLRIFSLLERIHKLLVDDEKVTLRELYYQMLGQDGGTVTQISEAVTVISIMLQIPRGQLRIHASSKGLVAGSICYTTADNVEVDCSHSTEGESIPNDLEEVLAIQSSARLVMVVEKDAVFQRLLDEKFLDSLPFEAILITGKGFPDLNTRQLLHRLAFEELPRAQFICLVDGNPFGMEILSVYKYGSLATTFCPEDLSVPKLEWIGIYPSEFHTIAKESIQDLSEKDFEKARSLRERPYFSPHMTVELDQMLRSGKKVEIEHDQEEERKPSVLPLSEYLWKKLADGFE